MSLQDEMLEQNRLYQATMQENEDLKELLTDYEALVEDVPDEGEAKAVYLAWETRRRELQQRFDALLKTKRQQE